MMIVGQNLMSFPLPYSAINKTTARKEIPARTIKVIHRPTYTALIKSYIKKQFKNNYKK